MARSPRHTQTKRAAAPPVAAAAFDAAAWTRALGLAETFGTAAQGAPSRQGRGIKRGALCGVRVNLPRHHRPGHAQKSLLPTRHQYGPTDMAETRLRALRSAIYDTEDTGGGRPAGSPFFMAANHKVGHGTGKVPKTIRQEPKWDENIQKMLLTTIGRLPRPSSACSATAQLLEGCFQLGRKALGNDRVTLRSGYQNGEYAMNLVGLLVAYDKITLGEHLSEVDMGVLLDLEMEDGRLIERPGPQWAGWRFLGERRMVAFPRQTRRTPSRVPASMDRGRDGAEWVVGVTNHDGNHWTGWAFHFRTRQFYFIDSLWRNRASHTHLAKDFACMQQAWHAMTKKKARLPAPIVVESLQQSDGFSCGQYAVYMLGSLVREHRTNWTAGTDVAGYLKRRIAHYAGLNPAAPLEYKGATMFDRRIITRDTKKKTSQELLFTPNASSADVEKVRLGIFNKLRTTSGRSLNMLPLAEFVPFYGMFDTPTLIDYEGIIDTLLDKFRAAGGDPGDIGSTGEDREPRGTSTTQAPGQSTPAAGPAGQGSAEDHERKHQAGDPTHPPRARQATSIPDILRDTANPYSGVSAAGGYTVLPERWGPWKGWRTHDRLRDEGHDIMSAMADVAGG